ncbi:NAD(P)-binding protein [Gonapodya prolifera JEL478]|uniref:NAD(P)-binding protein n=1 Tax=Gonapodya prolifera (strain JEL478) TaxID=1344416 RepID=A0A139ANY8_GONPJ|nr:NAD(P)-binding protein [Gonapodya prolifera JEL478]|eukprot:KXS18354.1 NAD(P)-binding protein [Gonapodya prolifera JEL478]
MKAVVVSQLTTPEGLAVSDVADPICPPNGIIVKVKAIGLNFVDFLRIQGKHQHKPKLPFVGGMEWAGHVIESGAETRALYPIGTRLFGGVDMTGGGCWQEKVLIVDPLAMEKTYRLFRTPESLSYAQSCNVMANYNTAWAGLVLRGQLKKGELVLIHAAAGGVGLAAVHVAKYYGCTVIGTASSAEKLDVLKRNGCDYGINYAENPDWVAEVKKISKGLGRKGVWVGVDVVYDPVGFVTPSLSAAAWNCRILLIGFVARDAAKDPEMVPMNRTLIKQISIVGVRAGENSRQDPSVIPGTWKGIFDIFESTPFRPVVYPGKYVGLGSIPRGLVDLASRKTYGKVVVELEDEDKSHEARL